MRKLQANNKRLVPLILCSVLVLQQSLANQASAGTVTDVNGNAIPTHPGTGAYELRPDAINKDALVGFKQFQNFKLSEGEIANFIFQALQHGRGPNGEQQHIFTDINTFVNFVQKQGEIKGIVNAVQSLGGGLKSDGNLVFISPNGMIVGSSGVLNVGSLQVLTPSVDDFDKMRNGIPDPNYTNFSDGSTHVLAQDINKTYNPADPMARSGSGQISIDGKVYARGDVELAGGKVGVGNGGLLIAGLGNNTQVLKNQNAADTLFNSLVNVDNMNTGNGFANANGKIVITSNVGTKVDAGGAIKNFGANSSTTITNTGTEGIQINGEVSNPNGNLTITNKAGALNVGNTGELKNKGTMTITNEENGTGLTIDGTATNDGTLNITNSSGDNGLNIGGKVTNNTGAATILNQKGGLNVNDGATVTSNGTSLDMDNYGADGLNIAGLVDNNAGEAGISNINTDAGLNVLNGGRVSNAGTKLLMSNSGNQGLNIAGTVESTAGSTEINNMGGGLHVTDTGLVENSGASLDMNNTGDGGFTIDGTVNNNSGTADLYNENNKLLISSTGRINSKGSELNVTNKGTNGMHIQGIVKHQNTNGKVNFVNQDSNMVIGHETTEFNIDSDADVNIKVTDGNILNYGVPKTLIRTTNKADLNMDVLNGSIGEDLGLCDGGICTGVGPGERDLTKSINTEVDGSITAYSKGNGVLINIASLDKDMHVNKIHSDGKVILLADDKLNKGATAYDIINTADDNTVDPNLKGNAISAIASGNIGENKDNKLTFIQTGATVDIANENDDASKPHELYDTPKISANGGVEFLAIGDVNIKGLDNADGTKNDTNVCTIASRTGSVNAEFSGNTYIRDITAQDEVNVVNRGPEIYIENLGGAPSRYAETGDYYGNYDGIVPERANIKALDLGTVENPNHTPNSTIVIKNGTINGKGSTSHPGLDQDVTVTADNAYVGGYYFNMGKHRYDDPNNPQGLTTVTKDDHTNKLVNAGDPNTDVSIRGKAVRPDDVTEIGRNPIERDYYYADLDGDGEPDDGYDPGESGSGQKDDPTFDPDKETGDDLVVPVPGDDDDDGPVPGDDDDDDDGPVPGDDDDDDDGPVPGDDDDDDDGPVPGDDDDDDDGPVPGDDDDDDDGPIPGDDDDDDDGPIPGDDDDGPEPIPPTPTPDFPDMDAAKQTWKKEYNDYISVIDKRQNIRFDITTNQNPVVFESSPEVGGLLNISRGGVQLTHNKSLKVGDIIPVHIQYGDVEVNANVKIVSASDVTAGAEFVDLDQATANKLLYLSLLKDDGGQPKEEYYANTNYIENENLSTTGVDD